jgi:hypothetical protein
VRVCRVALRGCLESIKQVIFILGNREGGRGQGQGEALKRLNFNGFIFCLCPNHLGGCSTTVFSLTIG